MQAAVVIFNFIGITKSTQNAQAISDHSFTWINKKKQKTDNSSLMNFTEDAWSWISLCKLKKSAETLPLLV